MKTKLFTLLLAVAASVGTTFAARDVVPSDAVLANYYEPGQLCVCIFVPAELDCSQVVFPGTYNRDANDGWITDVKTLAKFEPVEGYDGWYVLAVNDETPADFQDRGIQGKPVVLDQDGNFNWAYQVGDVTVIRGGVTVVAGGFSGEIDLVGYTKDAPNVFIINALKANANPCTAVYHNYTITVISDGCDGSAVPYLIGNMTYGEFQQMQLNEAKTQELGVPVYYYNFKCAEGKRYQVLSGLKGADGAIIEQPSWDKDSYLLQLVDDLWFRYTENGNVDLTTGANVNITFDVRQKNLCWARCTSEDSYTIFGTCGENLTWRLSNNGTLTISGTGAMADYTYNTMPWYEYRSSIKSVIINDGVTSIGEYAFYGCSGLASVTIEAETPPALGSYAFNNTNNCPIYVPCGTLDAYKTAWSYSSRITHSLSQECIYTISTTSANPEWGTTAGDTAALYLEEVEISAIPNYGYHFVRWNDNNRSNPRTVSVTEEKTYTATFAKNVYTISTETNSTQGYIYGNAQVEYLDFNELTAVPNYGYHFTQWSDGLKDNPRIAQITQDTTFTAEFAYDRVGTCGKDLALVWSYDPNSKVLTIGNAGEFTENMRFGVEAPGEMEELVIGNSVTAIGENAFAGISTLKKVTIGESVKTIHNNAFYNCVNLETIFNYRPTPTNAYSTAFDGVDKFECKLYILPSSIDMYKNASVWRDFYYTYAIGAEEATVTTNNVTVEPQDNAATVTWPTSENAATYTIEITKDGEVFCTLIFNANGQLTGIAFAPSRDGQAHAPAAIMTANGLQFTVTGLNSNTQYGYNLTAKDANDQTVATYSGSFTTTSEGIATGVEEISSSLQGGDRGRLILHNGQVFILRNGKTYTMQGQEVK